MAVHPAIVPAKGVEIDEYLRRSGNKPEVRRQTNGC